VFYFLPTVGFLLPLLLGAATLAAALAPISRRVPGPRWLTGSTVMMVFMVAGVGLIVLMGWLLAEPIQRQMERWPEIRQILNQTLQWWSDRLGFAEPWTVSALGQQILQSLTGEDGAASSGR
jgi:predicted PurR-regulated permease PerM